MNRAIRNVAYRLIMAIIDARLPYTLGLKESLTRFVIWLDVKHENKEMAQ